MRSTSTKSGPPGNDVCPDGFCQCGCGQKTKLASSASATSGRTRGEPLRFLHGHNRRKKHRYVELATGHATPCWIWQLAIGADGYGRVRDDHRMVLAHRYHYERQRGAITDGGVLDHLCRVRACVNPDHLEMVTQAKNVQRGAGAKLRPAQVAEIRSSTEPQHAVARRLGITQGQVSRIKAGRSWRPEPDSLSEPH